MKSPHYAADKTATSTCYRACASISPPVTVSAAPKAGMEIHNG
jgi:predicted lipoprotein with Yx(FWY)xxD motif